MTDTAVLGRLLVLPSHTAGAGRTPADAGPDTPIREDGFWLDSVALLELIVAAESEFGVEFDPTRDFDEATLRTAGSFAECIGMLGRLEDLAWYYRGRLRELEPLSGRARSAAVLRALARRARFARRRLAASARSGHGAPVVEARSAVFEAYRPLMRVYRPGPYGGPIAILWPEDEPERLRLGSDRWWRRAAPQRRAVLVPGAHLTCITEHAAALAAAMRACLRPDPPAR